MNLTKVVFVKHENSEKRYLFCAPESQSLKRGDVVVCRTANGDEKGVCATGSFFVSGIDEIVRAVGAYLPLKKVVGKVVKETTSKIIDFSDNDLPF